MSGVNKVFLMGNIGNEPELHYLANDVAVLRFHLATNEIITKNGEQVQIADWHNIVMWRDLAREAHLLLRKGSLVYLEGKLTTRSIDDKKTGTKKYVTDVIANRFQTF